MKNRRESISKIRFVHLLETLAFFLVLALFLFVERSGIQYKAKNHVDAYLPAGAAYAMKAAGDEKICLLLTDSEAEDSNYMQPNLEQMLIDMRVGYDTWDIRSGELPEFGSYHTAIMNISNLDFLGESILSFTQWVEEGGRALFPITLQKTDAFDLIAAKMGIIESGDNYATVDNIFMEEGFMLGGGREFAITDPYDSAMAVRLSENCRVYASVSGGAVPLIWEHAYGKGKFVVNNMGYYDKAYRGFFAASYSLLEDVCVYPVINGSSFYIDDFPSPVPSGNGEYIQRDYHMSIDDFYMNVWWPDMIKLAKKYEMKYTGMIIENYEDQVSGDLPRNGDISRYKFFGNMLLGQGGELGFHGYNHQPLCLESYTYKKDLGYNKWESIEEMKKSVAELSEFSKEAFPGETFSVYVPPSNVLSDEGRLLLKAEFPEIRAIASMYLSDGTGYAQEFEVAGDGMIETPRVISGCNIDEYMEIAAVSELNMHLVNSHFLHPDDLLDEDRGAALGWGTLKKTWEEYLAWLYQSVPDIRNLTGSQMAGAVERFCNISLWKEDTPEDLYLTVDGLYDEAYFLVRVNEGTVGTVEGGELKRLIGNLYLLHGRKSEIRIERNR